MLILPLSQCRVGVPFLSYAHTSVSHFRLRIPEFLVPFKIVLLKRVKFPTASAFSIITRFEPFSVSVLCLFTNDFSLFLPLCLYIHARPFQSTVLFHR